MKNIDLEGNKINTGDVLIELGRGGGYIDGKEYHSLRIWQKPSSNDGSGFTYGINGKKSRYWWTSVKNSIRVNFNELPTEFEYSFNHGMSDLRCDIKSGTIKELISKSNWNDVKINKSEVDRFEFMKTLKISTLDDVKENIGELKKGGYVPREIVSKVLELAEVGRVPVYNGEIGIAGMYDQMHYQAILEAIE